MAKLTFTVEETVVTTYQLSGLSSDLDLDSMTVGQLEELKNYVQKEFHRAEEIGTESQGVNWDYCFPVELE